MSTTEKQAAYSYVLGSLLTAGMIGTFTLLWSMSHSLTRIGDRLDSLSLGAEELRNSQSLTARELIILERRVLLLEQSNGVLEHGF